MGYVSTYVLGVTRNAGLLTTGVCIGGVNHALHEVLTPE